MEKFADWLSYQCLVRNYIQEEDINRLSFGIEFVLSNLISLGTVLISGIVLGSLLEACLFLLLFIYFRTLDDRFHAQSFWGCYLLTVGSFFMTLGVSQIVLSSMTLSIVRQTMTLCILVYIFGVCSGAKRDHRFFVHMAVVMSLNVIFAMMNSSYLNVFIAMNCLLLIISTVIGSSDQASSK